MFQKFFAFTAALLLAVTLVAGDPLSGKNGVSDAQALVVGVDSTTVHPTGPVRIRPNGRRKYKNCGCIYNPDGTCRVTCSDYPLCSSLQGACSGGSQTCQISEGVNSTCYCVNGQWSHCDNPSVM